MEVSESSKTDSGPFNGRKMEQICKDCFSSESERIVETGRNFLDYFVKNASSDDVLFKTIKEITKDIETPHQALTKVLKVLEDNKIIYRRNGIIGLWKE